MILSFFIAGKNFYISNENYSHIYRVNENRHMADKAILFIQDFIYNTNKHEIKKIIYSIGPASFTTTRIINSIVKGFIISNPKINFVGISSFLTYLSIVSKEGSKNGIIAIPTMRGDYFSCEYNNNTLDDLRILYSENIDTNFQDVYYENNETFKDLNLAYYQKEVLNHEISIKNKDFIKDILEVDYGFTPEYKYKNS